VFGYIWFLAGCLVSCLPQFLASSLAPNSMALCLLPGSMTYAGSFTGALTYVALRETEITDVSLVRGSYL